MFFNFDEVWYFQLMGIFGMAGAVLGLAAGRLTNDKQQSRLAATLLSGPLIAIALWLMANSIILDGLSVDSLIFLPVLGLIFLAPHCAVFWVLSFLGYRFGRSIR